MKNGNKGGKKPDNWPWPEGYVPQYKIQHRLFLFQHQAETQRVGWRHQIEAELGIRYSYWRDAAYRFFPSRWMQELPYYRPPRFPGDPPPERQENAGAEDQDRQLSLWDERAAA